MKDGREDLVRPGTPPRRLGQDRFAGAEASINDLFALWPTVMAEGRARQIDATVGPLFAQAANLAFAKGQARHAKTKLDPKNEDPDFGNLVTL